jgi:hypothetical protein
MCEVAGEVVVLKRGSPIFPVKLGFVGGNFESDPTHDTPRDIDLLERE